jgi:hypothetical protein
MTMSDYVEEVHPEEPEGELVHWMEPRPLTVGAAGISVAAASAFALGAVATVAVLALMHWLGPQQRALPTVQHRRLLH